MLSVQAGTLRALSLAVFLALAAPGGSYAEFVPTFEVKIVGTTGHEIVGMNNSGQVTGSHGSSAFSGDTSGVTTIMSDAYGGDINNSGVVAITSEASNPLGEVVLIPGGSIGTCNPQEGGWVAGMNDSGVVVGVCYNPSSEAAYYDGSWHYLPQIDETLNDDSRALDVNNKGYIVGWSRHWGSLHAPAVWVNGVVYELPCACGTGDGHSGSAQAINDAGQIVGAWSSVPTIWDEDWEPMELPRNGYGFANDINECGWIVGEDGDGAVLWRPDSTGTYVKHIVQDLLDPASSSVVIEEVFVINDLGWIGGMSSSGACILIPSNIDMADSADTDADGLWDRWEVCGVDGNNDGDYDLWLKNANPLRHDIYVEIDADQNNVPPRASLDSLVAVFGRAPVDNPNGNDGIALHFIGQADPDDRSSGCDPCIDESDLNIPEWDNSAAGSCSGEDEFSPFDNELAQHFGSDGEQSHQDSPEILQAKKKVFRYGISIGTYITCEGNVVGGRARDIRSNHFFIATGSLSDRTNIDYAAFIMHELGHTLGLRHGGTNDVNYKPNYFSVMNYLWKFPPRAGSTISTPEQIAAFNNFKNTWRLDYSNGSRNTLDENSLSEGEGIGGDDEGHVYASYVIQVSPTLFEPKWHLVEMGSRAVDWNADSTTSAAPIKENINYSTNSESSEILEYTTLTDPHDWWLLEYLPTDSPGWVLDAGGGSPANRLADALTDNPAVQELSFADYDSLWSTRFDCNNNDIYDDEEVANGDVIDGNENGIPDICESGAPVTAVPDPGDRILPATFALFGSSPNPFRSETAIRYDLRRSTEVDLRIFDISGRLVRVLVDAPQEAGRYTVAWDGRAESGVKAGAGIYFYRITTREFSEAKKLMLLR